MEYRLIVDQSTSGSKVLLVDTEKEITILNRKDLPHQQIYPQKGWVEHDPIEIFENVKKLISEVLADNKLVPSQIKSISITNQRESVVLWDKQTGVPYTNVLVWQCNRGLEICQKLNLQGLGSFVNERTGLTIDPYFSASKLQWFFDTYSLDKEQLKYLAIGTMETWLLWNLTDGKKYLSEISNACRTLLFNIYTKEWDTDLLEMFHVPVGILPPVVESVYSFGEYMGIPIISIVADSQAALYGNQCNVPGMAKATLGTGCSVLMNIGTVPGTPNEKILTTIAWEKNGEAIYALEGIIRSFGDILNWEKNTLQLFDNVQMATEEALALPDNGGVYFIPALEGFGAPFWEPSREASFEGITRDTTKPHLIRASLDAMLFQIRAVLDECEKSWDIELTELHVDGGVSKNELLLQMLADTIQKSIICGKAEELSALGALTIAMENPKLPDTNRIYSPQSENEEIYQKWLMWVQSKKGLC